MDNKQIQNAVKTLKDAIVELLAKEGELRNSEIAETLHLHTSHDNAQKDYLTYSLLGELLKENRVEKIKDTSKVKYKLKSIT